MQTSHVHVDFHSLMEMDLIAQVRCYYKAAKRHAIIIPDSHTMSLIIVPDPCLTEPCDPNASCQREGLLSDNFTCSCNPPFTVGDGFNCSCKRSFLIV